MPDLKTNGYAVWRPGQKLAWIHFFNKGEERNEWIYQPTSNDIVDLCRRFGLESLEILDLVNMIEKKDAHIAGFMVDVERYREAKRKEN